MLWYVSYSATWPSQFTQPGWYWMIKNALNNICAYLVYSIITMTGKMSNWFFDGSFKWVCLLFGRKSHSTLSSVILYIIIIVLCILVGSPCFYVSPYVAGKRKNKVTHMYGTSKKRDYHYRVITPHTKQ